MTNLLFGNIKARDGIGYTVDVQDHVTPDGEAIELGPYLRLCTAAKDDQDDFYLDKGERVALLVSNDYRVGVILGVINTENNPANTDDADIVKKTYKDGSYMRYDRKNHKYDVYVSGSNNEVNVKADSGTINVEGSNVTIKASGEVKIEGTLHVTGDIKGDQDIKATNEVSAAAGVIKLTQHKHTSAAPGSPTSTPIP